jgi:hypothetical protein
MSYSGGASATADLGVMRLLALEPSRSLLTDTSRKSLPAHRDKQEILQVKHVVQPGG